MGCLQQSSVVSAFGSKVIKGGDSIWNSLHPRRLCSTGRAFAAISSIHSVFKTDDSFIPSYVIPKTQHIPSPIPTLYPLHVPAMIDQRV